MGTVTSTLAIPDSYPIFDLNVRLKITHKNDDHLDVFLIAPDGTRVELAHEAFARHGASGAAYRDALAGPEGWPRILGRYAASVQPAETAPWAALTT